MMRAEVCLLVGVTLSSCSGAASGWQASMSGPVALDAGAPAAAGNVGKSVADASAPAMSAAAGAKVANGAKAQPCNGVGSTRPCCGNGVQTCSGGEFAIWGPCLDDTGAPIAGCDACGTTEFGAGCDAGLDAGPPAEGKDGGVDAGEPDAGTCGPGMSCKPGSIRYCDVAGIEWTKSVCDRAGKWGPCLETTAPQGAGCHPNSYEPENCCPALLLCCQDNPAGAFKDWGGGGCAAVACSTSGR